jgi:hypothetical protein
MGKAEDITHTSAKDVSGPFYGQVVLYLKRTRGQPLVA